MIRQGVCKYLTKHRIYANNLYTYMQKPLFITDKVKRTLIKKREQISPINMALPEHIPQTVLFKNPNP